MNCTEFQEILPEVFEAGRTAEQAAHLKSCPRCSGSLADLDLIAREARQLQELAEPSPRVWNSIEIELRREGVIHELQGGPVLVAPAREPGTWEHGWLRWRPWRWWRSESACTREDCSARNRRRS